jgi:hypothetical protein
VIMVIVVVTVVSFSFILAMPLEPWVDEAITAVAYFISCMAMIRYYFAPKMYLLLTGADLDRHLRIVRKEKTAEELEKEAARRSKIYAATAEDVELIDLHRALVKVPKTVEECNKLVAAIQLRCMVLAQRDAMDISNSVSNQSSGAASRNSHHESIHEHSSYAREIMVNPCAADKPTPAHAHGGFEIPEEYASAFKVTPQASDTIEISSRAHRAT